ncbi:unnamed protein product [Rhodiola kirilowii]
MHKETKTKSFSYNSWSAGLPVRAESDPARPPLALIAGLLFYFEKQQRLSVDMSTSRGYGDISAVVMPAKGMFPRLSFVNLWI